MSYKRVVITEFGGPEVLKVVEEPILPEPEAGQARVKVQAASATFTDVMVRKGVYYGLKETPPFPPGYDFVGVVDKLGPGTNTLKVGQMVADLTVFGAYSEYIVRPVISLVPLPDGLDSAEAVSLVLSYVTAYQMLHRIAKVKSGDRILVHDGGGAVGSALLQLGQLLDLEMYATASKSKHELISSLGGIHIDYESEDFVEKVLSVGGADAVFDPFGGDNYKQSFKTLKKGGMLVAYGFYNNAVGKGGNVPLEYLSIALWDILPNGRKSVFYSIVSLRKKHPDWFTEDLTELFNLLADSKIEPVIEKRMALDQAAEAHELIEQAAVKGCLVLEIKD